MKRVFGIVVITAVVLMLTSLSAHALLRRDMSLVRGKVVSYDTKTRMLTVLGTRGEGNVTFDISGAQVTAPTNAGDDVVVIYKIEGNKAVLVKMPPNQ